MTTGSAKMTHGGAGGLAAYLMEEQLVGYYAEASGRGGQRIRSFGNDDVIFRADQVHGHGVEAMDIDLTAGLTFGQFRNLCEGKHADTGEQLVQLGHRDVLDPDTGERIGSEIAHTMAIDTYFAAPKPVSVLCVVAAQHQPELVPRIVAAHEAAVREASDYGEQECRLGRRTVATPAEVIASGPRLVTKPGHARQGLESKQQGSKSERIPVDIIAISATQHTARPNDVTIAAERMPDPHLHTHNLFMGPAYDAQTGKWVQIDDYGLKSTAVRRDADYMGALARNLQEIGVELEFGSFEDGKNGRAPWRVKGITDEAVKFFSTNHERKWSLKRDLEDKLGRAVPEKLIQDAMRLKRRAKDVAAKKQDSAPVYELWQQDAARFDVKLADDALIDRLTARRRDATTAPYEERRSEFLRRLYGEKGLTKDNAEFDGKAVAEGIARCAEGLSFTPDDRLHLELEVMNELVVQHDATEPAGVLYTTRAMLDLESVVAEALADKADSRGMSHPTRVNIGKALDGLDATPDDEQMAAIRAATSGRGLTIIDGWAGTGKTTSLKAVVDAGRLPGSDNQPAYDQIIVVSTAALTAQSTGAKLQADQACSIESFVSRVQRNRISPTARTLVIVDEASMTNTFAQRRLLESAGPAQMILVGDPEQAEPIGPGGTFQAAVEAHGAHELTQVWRQRDQRDRADFAKLRSGDAGEMLESLDARFRLHIAETSAERIDLALDFYQAYRESGRSASDVRIIVDSSNVAVDECNRHIQRHRRERGEIGARGIEVESRAAGRRWTLHQNDLVMFLEPTRCGRSYVANGTTGQITNVDPTRNRVQVRLDDKRVVDIKLQASAESQPLGVAYAVHSLKFQGSEVPIVLAVPGGPNTTNKHTAYSTLTRCTEEAHVFADKETHGDDPKSTLKKAWSQMLGKTTASSRSQASQDETTARRSQRSGARDQGVHARRDAAYLERIERIAGPETAERVQRSRAYPKLQQRLGELRQDGANEREMLTKAVRQRELIEVRDPAAVLVYRLDHMERISRKDSAMGMTTPVDRAANSQTGSAKRTPSEANARVDARAAWRERQQQQQLNPDQSRDQGHDFGL